MTHPQLCLLHVPATHPLLSSDLAVGRLAGSLLRQLATTSRMLRLKWRPSDSASSVGGGPCNAQHARRSVTARVGTEHATSSRLWCLLCFKPPRLLDVVTACLVVALDPWVADCTA